MKRITFLIVLAVAFIATIAAAEVPGLINHQGILTDDAGVALDTTVSMAFSIYTDSTAGSVVWTENQSAVLVSSGIFHVLLGSVNSIPDTVFNSPERWLGVQVGADPELEPRQRIVTAGYSFHAAEADTAKYATSGAADNDWVRETPDSVLFTANYLGIARGGARNALYGDSVHTHTNLGIACTTGAAGENWEGCTVGGGRANVASSYFATVGGGLQNTASDFWATVGGGIGNTAGFTSAVCGGSGNTASGTNAFVGAGHGNTASGQGATVPGGWANTAQGHFSFAAGFRAKANHEGTFVWADYILEDFVSTANSQFLIRASGGVGIGTNSPTRKLWVNGDAGGTTTWYNDSDKRLKKNIRKLENALVKVTKLQGVSFEWKDTEIHPEGCHLGMIAQEVKEVVPEVVDQKGEYYSMATASLIPLLIEAIKEQQKQIDALKTQLGGSQ